MLRRSLVLIPLLAIGCGTPPAPELTAFGTWRVTGSTCPGDCALSPADRAAWRGRVAAFERSQARFAEHVCSHPRYNASEWPATGVYGGARLQDIGIAAASVPVVEVQCADQQQPGSDSRWQAPGSFLVLKDRDHLLVIWEGVFFELTRDAHAAQSAADNRERPRRPA